MPRSEELADKIVEALEDFKGQEIVKIDLRKIENCFCSFFVICHGSSTTHVSGMADLIEEKVREDLCEKPYHTEGANQAQWIVLDYGDVVAHIFQQEQRFFYQLEDFWADAKITNVN